MKEQTLIAAVLRSKLPIEDSNVTFITDYDINELIQNTIFSVRGMLEINEEYKQLIPYVVLNYKDKYATVKRLSKQTEKRLHNKYSLGIGGHIEIYDFLDSEDGDFIDYALRRELTEETTIDETQLEHRSFIGLINDDSTPVGRVHIGLLYVIQVDSDEIYTAEDSMSEIEWLTKEELQEKDLEVWSKTALSQL